MGRFWRAFWYFEILIVMGIVVASLPSWLLKGIPQHSDIEWTRILFGSLFGTIAVSLLAAYCTVRSRRPEDEVSEDE